MQTKGQSMTLSYWRERCGKFESKCDDLGAWIDTLEEYSAELGIKLVEARRIAGNQRSQKNYWKKRAINLRAEKERRIEERKHILKMLSDVEGALIRESNQATEYYKENVHKEGQIKELKELLSLEVSDKNWWKERSVKWKKESDEVSGHLTISLIILAISVAFNIYHVLAS